MVAQQRGLYQLAGFQALCYGAPSLARMGRGDDAAWANVAGYSHN